MPPIGAAVHAEIQPLFRSQKQQVGGFGILKDALGMGRNVLSVHQSLPRLASVHGAVQIGIPIVSAVVVGHNVDFIRRVRTDMDEGDPRPLRQALEFGAVVGPRLPPVCGVLQPSIVGAHPQLVGILRGRCDAQNRAVVFRFGGVDGQATTGGLLQLVWIVGGQIRTQRFPSSASVGAVVHALRTKIKAIGIRRIQR